MAGVYNYNGVAGVYIIIMVWQGCIIIMVWQGYIIIMVWQEEYSVGKVQANVWSQSSNDTFVKDNCMHINCLTTKSISQLKHSPLTLLVLYPKGCNITP